jgi:glycosyltransferase involved in cell wall biosynthesis
VNSFSIIIPVRNEGANLELTVDSIVQGRRTELTLEIVIVDDASTDGCCDFIFRGEDKEHDVHIRYARVAVWSGIPWARNYGAQLAVNEIFIFTDANVIFPVGWDAAAIEGYQSTVISCGVIQDYQTGVNGYGCGIEFPSMGVKWIRDPEIFHGYVPIAASTCTIISRTLFLMLGGYNEDLPLYGAAEPEFSVRAWLYGFTIVLNRNLTLVHKFKQPRQHDSFLRKIASQLVENYLVFALLYLPEYLLLDVYKYYEKQHPEEYSAWLARFFNDTLWNYLEIRRKTEEYNRVRGFEWFVETFGLARSAEYSGSIERNSLAVVIITHREYFPWLPQVLRSIIQQRSKIDQAILVVNDDCEEYLPQNYYNHFEVIHQKFASVNDARNAALQRVLMPWVCYVDGDNLHHRDYFSQIRRVINEVSDGVGIIYPDLVRVSSDGVIRTLDVPDWNFWTLREKTFIDTSSAWRTAAIRQAGGWFTPADCLQDHTTALQITRCGWEAFHASGVVSFLTAHEGSISALNLGAVDSLWESRHYVVVTLFAGRWECLTALMNWYMNECFPPKTRLIWLDNSNNARFSNALKEYSRKLRERAYDVQIYKNRKSLRNKKTFCELHDHVADLYNSVLARSNGDIYLTVEDDVIPPLGASEALLRLPELSVNRKWAAICAIYPSRGNSAMMCASLNPDSWQSCPIENFPPDVVEMGMIGAGFAAWNGSALHKCIPLSSSVDPTTLYESGWDATLCRNLRLLGYKVGIYGGIFCDHLTAAK